MNWNLLSSQAQDSVSIPESALYAAIGFGIVILGIAALIFVVWFVGKIMTKNTATPVAQPVKKVELKESAPVVQADELTEEEIVIITAALTAYYQTNKPKCEFTVKRIKKI